jgi:hypothetical protein
MFFGRCDLVFELFKNRPRLFKSQPRRHVRAKFGANRSRDGREKLAGEKKDKKSKPTEKYNITEILTN